MPTNFSVRSMRMGPALGLAALLVSVLTLVLSTNSACAETPSAYMQRVANELIAASRDGSDGAFATVLRSHADVPSIGLSALGSYSATLPKTDRPAYYNGMINWIARYASQEAPKYPVAKAIMIGQ